MRPVKTWRLGELLADVVEGAATLDQVVMGMALDSRRMVAGGLFLALPGAAGHGLDHAAEAIQRGAAAVLAEPSGAWPARRIASLSLGVPAWAVARLRERIGILAGRFWGDPSQILTMVGVTGTNGKSSVTQFLAQALAPETRCGVMGTLGSGFLPDLTASDRTTPDSPALQARLADFVRQGAGWVAMEVSSHALDQHRTAGVRFDTAVLTNLSRDHLDYHGDMAGYANAKRRLFESPDLRWAVLNGDDALGQSLWRHLGNRLVQCALYSLTGQARSSGAPLWVEGMDFQPTARGMRLAVETPVGSGELASGLIGRFNAANLLTVLCVLLAHGWPLPEALQRLSRIRGVAGRMECFGSGDQPLVVVDYAHTPDALEQALTALRDHVRGRIILVLGCGGERDTGKRPLMGRIAEMHADQVILTDDNPRHEAGDLIIREILAGFQQHDRVAVERDRARAIGQAIAWTLPDDALLIAGKGHETTQTVGDRVLPFSDRDEVQRNLGAWEGVLA
ncbi:MAG: UDP-N-acetylmuramoyl-L-alanyl-D-glutamate--2,6-diaminopimelate ligase [Pseudomonadota bacterium]